MPNTSVYIGLGANIGNIEENFYTALSYFVEDKASSLVQISSLYKTPPWGMLNQPDFLNLVAEVKTARSPDSFLELCLDIEKRMHRTRSIKWGPRIIDIDILLFGDLCVKKEGLTIPHPYMHERAFVLLPLACIAPHLVIGSKHIQEWVAMLDVTGIKKISFTTDKFNTFSIG